MRQRSRKLPDLFTQLCRLRRDGVHQSLGRLEIHGQRRGVAEQLEGMPGNHRTQWCRCERCQQYVRQALNAYYVRLSIDRALAELCERAGRSVFAGVCLNEPVTIYGDIGGHRVTL